ncbi:LysM repeat protein [Neobacillus niacini]|uniref:C40 family peptidase n=1 Tax=Neobacillus niacini TaxID=86668 RepID=UPI002854E87B|nr:LysM peptidoglycan-binding domain-containing protein [Neobacillus niacini]MDR7079595.1 LysM repeat protein [Neobacillus niacini]
MKKTIVRSVSTAALLSTVFAGSAYASNYTVQKGDTLTKIASKYQTTVPKIKELNGLTSDRIYANQTLTVTADEPIQPEVTTPAPVPAPTSTSDYVVVSGDYLGKIAKQFNTTVSELKSLNGLTTDMIYAGQTLKVSGNATPVTPPPAVAPSTPPADSSVTSEYTVVSGDTLSRIGLNYNMTVQALKSLNGLNSDRIYVGQKLKLTAQVSSTPSVPQTPPAPTGDFAASLVNAANSVMGVPYAWGGSSLNGFDCSGFIHYAANQAGKKIGRYSAEGYYSRTFYVDQPQPGDLVFFENTYKKGISHVGIYLGDNQFIHADEKKGISVANLSNPYYTAHFDGFKRFY